LHQSVGQTWCARESSLGEETLWGALNAVTAFVDHKQEITGDRYAHILFGSGATLKQKAYELALAQLSEN